MSSRTSAVHSAILSAPFLISTFEGDNVVAGSCAMVWTIYTHSFVGSASCASLTLDRTRHSFIPFPCHAFSTCKTQHTGAWAGELPVATGYLREGRSITVPVSAGRHYERTREIWLAFWLVVLFHVFVLVPTRGWWEVFWEVLCLQIMVRSQQGPC